jgi:maleate isomerase
MNMSVQAAREPTIKNRAWETLSCKIDEGLAARAAIGLLALAADGIIESELRRFLPLDGVAVFTSRIRPIPDSTPPSLKLMEEELPDVAGRILPGKPLDAIAFGCTSGAMAIGADRVAAKIATMRPGVPVTDPVSASLKALAYLGSRRIALLTPYVDSVNKLVGEYLTANGLAIAECASFKQTFATINRISEADICRAGIALGSRDVDALFISCTGLRCASIIETIERETGKPVVASNQALAWDLLRLTGIQGPVSGCGRLLAAAN